METRSMTSAYNPRTPKFTRDRGTSIL